jgi:hypothetical protein
MKLYNVDFQWLYESSYSTDEDNAQTKAVLEARSAWLKSIGNELSEHQESQPHGILLSREQMLYAVENGFKFELKGIREFNGPEAFDYNRFEQVANKLLNLAPQERAYNERCEVHMPGQALATYNEVMLCENSCSDNLQSQLDSGWRILAACPQPDQRRPDYILGRFNPKREVNSNAERSY